ncbi:glyoxylate/hydroxypyruvate reductase A [Tistrella mobilis]|uniref:2-hydroxyacid dehydrogenase n=1 Tax=Tistrella mobilis TaxID=171437 RepID=UPI0031F6638D
MTTAATPRLPVTAIIAPGWDQPRWQRALVAAAPGLEVRLWPDLGDVSEIEAVLLWKQPAGALAGMSRLGLAQSLGAGVEHLLNDPAIGDHVALGRAVDPAMTGEMVRFVVHAVLAISVDAAGYRAQQAAGLWEERSVPGGALRVGMLGLGELGAAAAQALAGLGFTVTGWSRSARQVAGVTCLSGADGLNRLIGGADCLVNLLPLTDETRGLIDAALLARLPRGAHLVNVARGGHVVEADLLAALDDGRLASATLDVTAVEPLPQGHPFWSHPKIVLTPHVAAASTPETMAPILAESLRRHAAGRPPLDPVERTRGY